MDRLALIWYMASVDHRKCNIGRRYYLYHCKRQRGTYVRILTEGRQDCLSLFTFGSRSRQAVTLNFHRTSLLIYLQLLTEKTMSSRNLRFHVVPDTWYKISIVYRGARTYDTPVVIGYNMYLVLYHRRCSGASTQEAGTPHQCLTTLPPYADNDKHRFTITQGDVTCFFIGYGCCLQVLHCSQG